MSKFKSYFYQTSDGEKLHFKCNFDIHKPINKTVLVFNYGLVCSEQHWLYQINYLKKEYPVLIHDYRGHFESSGKENLEKISIEQFSQDLGSLIQFYKINKVVMLGHSMGVNVCLEFAVNYPDLVEKLVLISGSSLSAKEVMLGTNIMDIAVPYLEKLQDKFPGLLKTFWSSSASNPIVRYIIKQGGFNPSKVSDEFIRLYLTNVGILGPSLFLRLFKNMSEHQITMHYPQIKCPVFIVSGNKDKVIPHFTQNYFLKSMPKAKLFTIKDGSHVPQVDFPALVNKKIKSFLNGNSEVKSEV